MQAELLASLSDPARLAPPLVRSFDAVFGTHPAAQGRAAGAAPKPRGRTKSATDTSASSTVRGGETAMFASAAERTASATECLARLVQTVHDFSKTLPPPPPQQPSSAVPGAPPRAPGGSSASSASAGVRTQQTVRRAVSTGQLRASAAPPDTAAAPAAELAASRPSSRPLSAAQQGRRLAKTASSANLRETSASATRKRDAADAASKASDPASPQRQAEFLDSALAIARTLFAAIELGLSPWHTESLQLEKLACNLVTRLMDCRAHAHAFEVMQYAFGRLGMYRPAPAAPKKSARGRSTSVGSRSARPVSRSSSVSSVRSAGSASESAVSGPASAAASAAALTPEAAALQGRIAAVLGWIASCPIDSSASLLLLQVALLLHINALRWVLVCKPNAGHDEALLKALLSNFGITGLCEQLREIDPKMAGGQCDCIFRILYTHASKQDFHTARYLYVAAVYFYVGSSGFTVKGLHALIQRPLLTKDKTLISGPANVIESYYHRIARLPALEQHFDLDCITWIDHAVQVSRQFPDLRPFWDDFSDRMLERGQEAMPACADALGYLRDCRALHVQLHTAISDPESDVEPGMLDALPTPASGFEFPRRLQLAVLSSLSLLREQLDLDHATLSAKAAAASSHPRARLAPLLSAAAVHVISTAEPFVTQMDADARARAARHVLDMMLLPPLYVAAFDITLPPELGALDQQLALAVEFGKRLGVESYARIIANGAYQSGALLLKRMRVADALPLIKMSVDLVPEAAVSADSGDSTVDARLHHCKRLDVLSFCQEEAGMHEDALDSVIAALRVFPLAAARSEGDGKSAALFEKLVGKHAHLSSMSSRAYNPVLAMLAQGECDSPATVEFVLDLELQMLAAAGMRGDAKLASLEHAAGHFEKSGNPLARARMLLDRARLLRQRHAGEACRVDENGDGSMGVTPDALREAVACCEQAIAVLKPLSQQLAPPSSSTLSSAGPARPATRPGMAARSGTASHSRPAAAQAAATPSMTLGDEARLELAMAHCELGISLNETGDFDPKPFHTALGMWKRALAHVPSFSLPLKKVPGLHKGMDAASAERLFDYIEMLCGYFGVLNQPINTLYCLRLLFKLVQLCPSKTLVDVLELYRDMAATYLALGCTGKAGVMFSLGKQLAESPKCTDAARQAFMSRYALFLASIGNLDKSSQAAAQADVLATDAGGVVTDDNEVLRRAQACLDKSFLSFSAAKLAQAVTEATVAYALLARLSRRAQARRGRGKAPTSAARAPKFACNFSATMMASCLWLGQVHGFQGSFMQAEAYLAKGLEAAQSQRSDGRIAEFAIALADLWARRLEVATAESYVATAARHAPKVAAQLPPHVAAGVRVAEADLQCRAGAVARALAAYEEANTALCRASDEKIVARLEDLPVAGAGLGEAAAPVSPRRAKSMSNLSAAGAQAPASKTAGDPSTAAAPSATIVPFTPLAKIKIKGKNDSAALLRCFGIDNLRADVMCRMADALGSQDKYDESWLRLARVEETEHDMFREAHYYAALAVSKLEVFLASQKGNQRLQMFSDSVFAMPWGMPGIGADSGGNGGGGRRPKLPAAYEKSVAQLGTLLARALELAGTHASTARREEVVLAWTLFQTIKAATVPDADDPAERALAVAVNLERHKAVTAQRMAEEIQMSRAMKRTREGQANGNAASGDCGESDAADGIAAQMQQLNLGDDAMGGLLAHLPRDLVVCSITMDVKRQDMYVTRIEHGTRAGGVAPVVVKLPLLRHATREGEADGLRFQDVDATFAEIMEASKASIRRAKEDADAAAAAGRDGLPRERVAQWRAERAELDGRLQVLLGQMESAWLGGFKGLLSGLDLGTPDLEPLVHLFKKRLEALMAKTLGKAMPGGESRAKAAVSLDADLCKALLRMGRAKDADDKEMEDVFYYLLDVYQSRGVRVEFDEVNIDAVTEDIKELVQGFYSEVDAREQLACVAGATGVRRHRHVVLVLDKHCQHLPWESLPVLRGASVSRMPSCAMLAERLARARRTSAGEMPELRVRRDSAFYVLNPQGDLVRTQREFEDRLSSERGWTGITARAPSETEFTQALATHDLLLYFGHGGAEQFVRGHAVQELAGGSCAAVCLFGCSSGYLPPAGEFEPMGTALDYMLGGWYVCDPALVANLWDVTDRDIDRFSLSMLARWGLFDEGASAAGSAAATTSMCEAVAQARDDTMLRYLIGAAPVVYGLPMWLVA